MGSIHPCASASCAPPSIASLVKSRPGAGSRRKQPPANSPARAGLPAASNGNGGGNDDETPIIATSFDPHALEQAQRRAVPRDTLALVLECHDRSRKVAGRARALWISRRGRQALVRAGVPPAVVDRAAGVRLIVCLHSDRVITVEHATARRRWC